MVRTRSLALALAAAAAGCAPALREPPPIQVVAPAERTGRTLDDLLREADAAFARRAEPEQARVAEELYAEAAGADETRVEGLLGLMRARTFRVEREKDAAARERLAVSAVQVGQWCQRRAPGDPRCDYALAVAIGQQTRERPSTADDALKRMVALLRGAIARDARQDAGGPHRVLALLLLRAPGWPLGPGDPEAALAEARSAAALFPDHAANQLALAEALEKNDRGGEAREAFGRALALAEAARARGDPDAERWEREARAGLGR